MAEAEHQLFIQVWEANYRYLGAHAKKCIPRWLHQFIRTLQWDGVGRTAPVAEAEEKGRFALDSWKDDPESQRPPLPHESHACTTLPEQGRKRTEHRRSRKRSREGGSHSERTITVKQEVAAARPSSLRSQLKRQPTNFLGADSKGADRTDAVEGAVPGAAAGLPPETRTVEDKRRQRRSSSGSSSSSKATRSPAKPALKTERPQLSAFVDIGTHPLSLCYSIDWRTSGMHVMDANGRMVTGWCGRQAIVLALARHGIHTMAEDMVKVSEKWGG